MTNTERQGRSYDNFCMNEWMDDCMANGVSYISRSYGW